MFSKSCCVFLLAYPVSLSKSSEIKQCYRETGKQKNSTLMVTKIALGTASKILLYAPSPPYTSLFKYLV